MLSYLVTGSRLLPSSRVDLTFFFLPLIVEVIEDDRVQILQSLTSAEAEVSHSFVNEVE